MWNYMTDYLIILPIYHQLQFTIDYIYKQKRLFTNIKIMDCIYMYTLQFNSLDSKLHKPKENQYISKNKLLTPQPQQEFIHLLLHHHHNHRHRNHHHTLRHHHLHRLLHLHLHDGTNHLR